MTADISPEAVAKMLDGVTDGPWTYDEENGLLRYGVDGINAIAGIWTSDADGKFFAYAREAVPDLATERDGYRKLALAGELTERHVDILTAERDALSARVAEQSGMMDAWREDLTAIEMQRREFQARAEAAEAENARLRDGLARLGTYEAFTNEGWGFSHPEIDARVLFARRAALKGDKP